MNTPTVEELGQRAMLARKEGRLSEALRDANDTVALCRQLGATEKLVRALMMLGQLERDLEQPREAIQQYEEAVSIPVLKMSRFDLLTQ